MIEHWLPVIEPGFSYYEVSDLGRVRNAKTGYVVKTWNTKPGRALKVELGNGRDVRYRRMVHKLVYEAHVGSVGTQKIGFRGAKDNPALSNLYLKEGATRALAISAKAVFDKVFAEQFPHTRKAIEHMKESRVAA